ncbi:MAG TPA: branched-chain amino acid ABC transporter permease [Candidatus Dormibacteraeota bacterium]|nr:branched-chain amino acid ABC transporter permease [Candidatus Dormibacteraeota bacterium]
MTVAGIVVGGLAIGAVYALVAIGLTLIFRATGIVNFAQGELLMIGAYTYVFLHGAGAPPAVQLVGSACAGMIAGLVLFGVTHFLLRRATEVVVIIGTLAISILLQAAARLEFTDNPMRAVPWLLGNRNLALAGAVISTNSLTIVVATLVIGGALILLFRHALLGKAMRAVAEDPYRAGLTGIPVRAMLAATWVAGGGVAGVAGLLLSPVTGVFPSMGAQVLFPALIAAALGGFESVEGVLLGGLVLGVVQTVGIFLVGGVFRDMITFGVLLAVLMWRPQGLFGARPERAH